MAQLGGRTLRQVGAYGINGTFFDTSKPELPGSTWGIMVNKGKPIGPNAHTNHWAGKIVRGTLIYADGKLEVKRINNIGQVKGSIDWAIGGVTLLPWYDPVLEKVPQDILRVTRHTGIGYKGGKVYLIVSCRCSMLDFKNKVKALGLDGAIALDGGGSTQMFWENNLGIHSARRLNNVVGVMS